MPDRQRTIRELELDKTFYKMESNRDHDTNGNDGTSREENYVIKHGPDDYKTGKIYGDRPPLVLTAELTFAIDDFITHWRPFLSPKSKHLFVQPRSGKPLSEATVYNIVSSTCYRHAGKKTNPHLLRDMIVTHVRKSTDASERELEALALYMGHSIAMQRSTYDRRTKEQKVAPAVQLLQKVNNN